MKIWGISSIYREFPYACWGISVHVTYYIFVRYVLLISFCFLFQEMVGFFDSVKSCVLIGLIFSGDNLWDIQDSKILVWFLLLIDGMIRRGLISIYIFFYQKDNAGFTIATCLHVIYTINNKHSIFKHNSNIVVFFQLY